MLIEIVNDKPDGLFISFVIINLFYCLSAIKDHVPYNTNRYSPLLVFQTHHL